MKTYPYRIGGDDTVTYAPESRDDLAGFHDFIARNARVVIGLDTETTSLRIYSPGFACRLVQFGVASEAWVLRADLFEDVIRETLARADLRFVAHNAPFDLLVLDRVGLADLGSLAERVFDTYILGHLLDPRTEAEGGTGLGLKALSNIYVDASAPDTAEGLYEVFRKEYGKTKKSGEGWAAIDIDHPVYTLYAGLDVILVTRLLKEVGTLVRENGMTDLANFEHRVQRITTRMQKRGLRIDVDYTTRLRADLEAEQEKYLKIAARYGVEKVNSPKQVVAALQAMGEEWSDTTDSGALSTSKEVLLPMADMDKDWNRVGFREPNPLADAILRAKRAKKWGQDYAQAFLDLRDESDRIHPNIRSLAARTARMSVSTPPLQQLPSSDSTIRSAIIADDGMVICAADYAQVEMRVLAGLADVKGIKEAVEKGMSIHEYTALMLFGEDYPKWKYKIAKNTGFCKVYGGGRAKIAQTSGVSDMAVVDDVVNRYEAWLPEIATYGRKLQRQAEYGTWSVTSPIGRVLPLDRTRSYAATNYVVQSTSRDILGQALCRIEDAGLDEYLLLPVHDEIIFQAPEEDAERIAQEIGRLMETVFLGVRIDSEAEVYGPSWGDGYK